MRREETADAIMPGSDRYRTKLCIFWLNTGGMNCPYGARSVVAVEYVIYVVRLELPKYMYVFVHNIHVSLSLVCVDI